MIGIIVHNVDDAIGYALVGVYFDDPPGERPATTDELYELYHETFETAPTADARETFYHIMDQMGYQFYRPWEEHDGAYIILPGQDFDTECKRIDAEIVADAPEDE